MYTEYLPDVLSTFRAAKLRSSKESRALGERTREGGGGGGGRGEGEEWGHDYRVLRRFMSSSAEKLF